MKKGLLLLDYDGTLAPFCVDRMNAKMDDNIKVRLNEILKKTSTKIVIISGRTIQDLMSLLQLDSMPEIWGSHGLERRGKRGSYKKATLKIVQKKGLEIAQAFGSSLVGQSRCEVKLFSVAVHVRGVTPSQKQRIFNKLTPCFKAISHTYGLEIMPFKEGLEIRIPGKDKGDTVRALLSKTSHDTSIAYLGDDTTDIAAFRALGKRGMKIIVGKKKIFNKYDVRLTTYADVFVFLTRWLECYVTK